MVIANPQPAPTAADSKSVVVAQIATADDADIAQIDRPAEADELATARATVMDLAGDRRVDAVLSQIAQPVTAPQLGLSGSADRVATDQAEQAVQTVRDMAETDEGQSLAVYA